MFVESLRVANYRGIDSLNASGFKHLNMIGGLNGVGKSTFLEALFILGDYENPQVNLRPFQWRNLAVSLAEAIPFIFTNSRKGEPASLDAKVFDGNLKIKIISEKQSPPNPTQISIGSGAASPNSHSAEGLTVKIFLNNQLIDSIHVADTGPGSMQGWRDVKQQRKSPNLTYLSSRTIDSPHETAARFTRAIQRQEKGRVLQLAQVVVPEVKDLILLQINGVPTLCGSIVPDVFVPLSFLGDGASAVINVGLAVLDSPDGAVFIDEFDARVHYSRLQQVWLGLAKVAVERNCQIFAATHSRESIEMAMKGVEQADLQSSFCYMRLDRIKTKLKCTTYDFTEIKDALSEDWEVR